MIIKHLLPLERIIAKVDNDFNIDNSDWIPRAAAWTIDALAQLKCLPYDWKKRKCEVKDGIAFCPNMCDIKSIKVYDNHGCIIDKQGSITMGHVKVLNEYEQPIENAKTQWTKEELELFDIDEYELKRLVSGVNCHRGNFVVIDENKIQINFDAPFVVIEYYGIATYYDDYFNEEVPFVYDNCNLLEAISWYILYKMLSRGYKHQVFSLTGQEPVNPYIQWTKLKDSAAASVKHDLRDTSKNEGWNNFFYNSTFLPRR